MTRYFIRYSCDRLYPKVIPDKTSLKAKRSNRASARYYKLLARKPLSMEV